MKNRSSAYEAYNQRPVRELRLVIKINFDTPVYITSHSGITGLSGEIYAGLLEGTASTTARINPTDARSEIGKIDFTVVDNQGAITTMLNGRLDSGEGVRGKWVELYSGMEGMDFSDYSLEQTQIIDEELTFTGAEYRFRCRDIQRTLRKDIFDLAETKLSADVGKNSTTIPVYDTSGFEFNVHGPTYTDLPNEAQVIYFKIKYQNGYEICSATGKTATSFTNVRRGLFGTAKIPHKVPADANESNSIKIEEYVYLELPAIEAAYALYTGKILGTAGTIPNNWHLGVSETLIRSTEFSTVGDDIYNPNDLSSSFIVRFGDGIKKTDGKKFIEKEIGLLAGVFFPVRADGSLGCSRITGVLSDADTIATLNTDNIISHGDVKFDLSKVHNIFDLVWSYLEFSGTKPAFYRQNVLVDEPSITKHEVGNLKKLAFKGLHNSRHTYTTLKNKFDALRDRHAGPPVTFTASVFPSMNGLEIGDIVEVDLPHIKDQATDLPFKRAMEIQRVKINQNTGKIDLDLFGSFEKAGAISDGATYTLPDGWYSSEGAALTSVATITSGVLDADVTLTGGETSRTIFYYLGDLTIPSGRTLTIEQNVELRVMGHLQVDGDIICSPVHSDSGYIGYTYGGQGTFDQGQYSSVSSNAWRGGIKQGRHNALPPLELENSSGVLVGVPADMRGSGGAIGGAYVNGAGETIEFGGIGGSGGSSLVLVARGMALGGAGEITLDGGDGTAGPSAQTGSGGGGAPGVFVFLQDGAQGTTPFLAGKVSGRFGVSPNSPSRAGKSNVDISSSCYRILFVPQSRDPYPDYVVDPNLINAAGRVYRQPTAPTSPNEDDIWYDTANQNHAYVYDGSSWVSVQDGEILDVANNALTNAAAAQSAANAAQTDAAAANEQIAYMGSDSKLTPVEKKRLIREVEDIHEEQVDIVAKADIYGIVLEKNNYNTKITNLDNYLLTLSSPTAWDDLSGNTNIPDFAFFKSYFGLVYANRQKLLNKIAEEAGKVAEWDGVTGSGRPADYASANLALEAVPGSTGTASIAGNTITKTSASGWDTGVRSKEKLSGSVVFIGTISSLNKAYMAGLTTNSSGTGSYHSLNFAWYVRDNGALSVYEDGVHMGEKSSSYAIGDIISIELEGNSVKYYHNGELKYTSPNKPLPLPHYFDSSFRHLDASLTNISLLGGGHASPEQARRLQRSGTLFYETFEESDSLDDWLQTSGPAAIYVPRGAYTWQSGGGSILCGDSSGNDQAWLVSKQKIPFNPNLLYKITFVVRQSSDSDSTARLYAGVSGIDESGSRIDVNGTNRGSSLSSSHYFAATNVKVPQATMKIYSGWFKGTGTSGNGGQHSSASDPGTLHEKCKFFSPMFIANYNDKSGRLWVDSIVVESFDPSSTTNATATIINPLQLAADLAIDQGDGVFRRAPFGLRAGLVRDGQSITFNNAFSTPPTIRFRGGLTFSNSLSGNHAQSLKAVNVTTSGFDVVAKVKELAGSTNARSDTGAVAGGGGYDYAMHKGVSAQAYDDNYTFQIDVRINNTYDSEFDTYFPGFVKVGFYTNDGSGWVKRGEETYNGQGGAASTTDYTNQQKSVTVDGLTNHGGYEFAVDVIAAGSAGGQILSFDGVTYTTASAPSQVTATPTGAEDLYWDILAGE